jgi:hypothetical protein
MRERECSRSAAVESFLYGFVGELFGQDEPELYTEFLARELAVAAGMSETHDFHAGRFGATELFNGEGEKAVGLCRDGEHTAGKLAVVRPEMQERLLQGTAYFPGKRMG